MSPAPKISASITLFRLFCASLPPSLRDLELGALGQRLVDLLDLLRAPRSATDTVLASRERVTDRPTFGLAVAQRVAGQLGEAVLDGGHLAQAHDLVAAGA